ncbi:hypothetical protein A2767_02625 [Candidatus Roizmanbacteria bacterium RIFCSPHIGHO2_01_FULL_35_10]|uniref:Uncharacterized protein n=1 Tax=Candidatus Roizmanbacteria bacterium RIFCSPLOWO2_01_FULL_35_13 TaxID=1802055 RepID=A0A1F7I7X3_9BACT|nr:MAG: hypothetical protein A2767_02625 [Candidatus Roizmanbacteria bacterium RIFCSPHIGHO2_01_FULL_35_10]OGK39458.1 MAG: hypothetical protein A3A74_06090 [Candidatus Roizmanbacteria bacterium RIFCSPLOWO2_01_FULL_35_13]
MNDQDPKETETLAQEASVLVKSAEPSLVHAVEQQEKARTAMVSIMTDLREATKTVGNLGAQVGEGSETVFILKEPLAISKKLSESDQSTLPYNIYVVATEKGFKGIEMVTGTFNHANVELEANLRRAIKGATDGIIESKVPSRGGLKPLGGPVPGVFIAIPTVDDKGHWIQEGYSKQLGGQAGNSIIDIKPDQVDEAIRFNIKKAQEPHKLAVNQAKVTQGNAANVRAHIDAATKG